MDTITASEAGGSAARGAGAAQAADPGRSAPFGAAVVLLGTLISTIGIAWDVQWHVDVGPDTFFTLPHLALYAGSAISGIASLVMVLSVTGAQRAGHPVDRSVGGIPIRVFGGAFSAPLGYLVAGVGAAAFLIYGLLDLWWHSIYGFDATLNSPPHVALFLSIALVMIGSVMVFAAAREHVWGRAGLLLASVILLTFSPMTTNAVAGIALPFDVATAAVAFYSVLFVVLPRLVLGRRGTAVGVAVVVGVMQGFLWWFSPWAAHAYAAGVGLPLRDGLTPGPPELPGTMPMFLLVVALVVELLPWIARRGRDATAAVVLVSGLCGVLTALSMPLQAALTDPSASIDGGELLVDALVGLVVGLLAGFLASRFTVMLQVLAPPSPHTPAPDPAGTTSAVAR